MQILVSSRLFAATAVVLVTGEALVGAEPVHEHAPVTVNMRPHVVRMRVSLVRPQRVVLDQDGGAFIADAGARSVFHVTGDRRVSLIAENLDGPAGLALDADGRVYISLAAGGRTGDGRILRAR